MATAGQQPISRLDAVTAYIALGANLGDAAAALHLAVKALGELPLTQVLQTSSFYKTAPMGADTGTAASVSTPEPRLAPAPPPPPPVNDYINAVVQLETRLTAPALLEHLQQIEQDAGRERPYRNAPRTLDLDLLLYGSASIDSLHLTVPHPRMWQRAFVLVPLAEIAPALVMKAQLDAVADQEIERLHNTAH